MSHPSRRQGQQPATPPAHAFIQNFLGHVIDSVQAILHPSLCQRLLRQVGVAMGRQASREYQETHRPSKPFSQEDYLHCIETLKRQWGWEHSTTTTTAGAIEMSIPVCPFGKLATDVTGVCHVESGILGGIAGDHFGWSKVTVHRGQGSPPRDCRIRVYLNKSERQVAAEGAVYPEYDQLWNGQVPAATQDACLAPLSRREREVLKLVGEGVSNKAIAAALQVSVRTVEGHLTRIQSKLAVKGRAHLVRLALRSALARL